MSADFITLTCPACGAKLQITEDIDRFACGHCGHEHIVRRQGGIVSLAPVLERLDRVEAGTNRTAAELAIGRLTREIRELETELQRVDALPYPKPTTRQKWAGWGAIFFIVIATPIGATGPNPGIAFVWVLLGIAALVYWFYLGHRREDGFRTWKRQEIQRLQEEIVQKQERLRTNRQLAEGE